MALIERLGLVHEVQERLKQFPVCTLLGPRQAGKTTLALQYLLEGESRGEKGLFITLSESYCDVWGHSQHCL